MFVSVEAVDYWVGRWVAYLLQFVHFDAPADSCDMGNISYTVDPNAISRKTEYLCNKTE